MFQSKVFKFTQRRRKELNFLKINVYTMRFCHNCSSSSNLCRIDSDSNKCTECVRKGRSCDLTPLNTARWRRLKEQRKKLKAELKEAYAKQQRLLRQIDHLKEEQRMMMKSELNNIAELKQKKATFFTFLSVFDFFIDVFFEAIVLPEG